MVSQRDYGVKRVRRNESKNVEKVYLRKENGIQSEPYGADHSVLKTKRRQDKEILKSQLVAVGLRGGVKAEAYNFGEDRLINSITHQHAQQEAVNPIRQNPQRYVSDDSEDLMDVQ